MATVNYVLRPLGQTAPAEPIAYPAFYVVAWENMANGDVGEAFDNPLFADASFHVAGTFGSGGTIQLEGDNSGVDANYQILLDPQFNQIALTVATNIPQVMQVAYRRRPNVSAGDGTTSLSAYLLVCRPHVQIAGAKMTV